MYVFKGISGYLTILALMILEGIGFPVPSEVIMPLVGYFSKLGYLDLLGGVLVGTLGSLTGSIVDYYLALKLGPTFVRKFGKYVMLDTEKEAKLVNWFNRHGILAVFGFRFVPKFRALISFPAGLARMNFVIFIVFTFLGHFIWDISLAYAGFSLYNNINYIIMLAEKFSEVLLIVTLVLIAIYVIYKYKFTSRS
ncbi:DedA family protein [Stygiolobus caldivivus]|uniref:DedA family protein n=1 Tax=Stygiolobus caldivivus TaxID=2824673 RepID=A0A8D5U4K3_9CREN|nr:DedA family protein [Stygiolobus caldivivus]BCU69355.1 DedA family protein [Stygiolobus caldivivus]